MNVEDVVNISVVFNTDFEVRLYKMCFNCLCLFPSVPLKIDKYCPRCRNTLSEYTSRTLQKGYLKQIKHDRYVPIRVFDLYDKLYPIQHRAGINGEYLSEYLRYERVCRFCGERLLKKDGTHSTYKRYCQNPEHSGERLLSSFSWSFVREAYINEIFSHQKPAIKAYLVKKVGPQVPHLYFSSFLFCESCGKFCKRETYAPHLSDAINGESLEQVNIHHRIPVYSLNEENIMLIFDYKNLICLCESCHKKNHEHVKVTLKMPLDSRFKRISDYF